MIFRSINEKFIFYVLPVCLFLLLPLFLISGPLLTDLSVSLICLIFLIYCFRLKNFSYFKNKYFYFFLLFWLYLVLNSSINSSNIDSLKIAFFYGRYGVFVVAVLALIEFEDKFLKYFFYSILICFIVLILDGFYQYFVGENLFGNKTINNRVSSLFGDELILGSYISRLWPIFFGLFILFIKKNKFFHTYICIFILAEVLIFLSGDRTAFFYLNFSAIFVIMLSQKLLKLRLFSWLCGILILALISFLNPSAKERVIDLTLSEMNLVDEQDKGEKNISEKEKVIFTKQHTAHYITAYRMFLDNKILGVGIKNYRNFCNDDKYLLNKFSCSTHPHNTYIQILSETGIIGFLFLIIFLIYFCYYLFKHFLLRLKKKYLFTDFEICILSGVAIYLWPFVPTGNIFNNWLNIIFILNLPLFIWSIRKNKQKT